MADATTTVQELRDTMRAFIDEREWSQFHSPKNLAVALICESAEFLEHFQWISLEDSAAHMKDAAKREAACEELADVLGVCLALANALGVDLSEVFARKMSRNVVKYPADKARGRYRLED